MMSISIHLLQDCKEDSYSNVVCYMYEGAFSSFWIRGWLLRRRIYYSFQYNIVHNSTEAENRWSEVAIRKQEQHHVHCDSSLIPAYSRSFIIISKLGIVVVDRNKEWIKWITWLLHCDAFGHCKCVIYQRTTWCHLQPARFTRKKNPRQDIAQHVVLGLGQVVWIYSAIGRSCHRDCFCISFAFCVT